MRKLLPVGVGVVLLFVVGLEGARCAVVFEDSFDKSPTGAPPQGWTARYYGWAGQPEYSPEVAAGLGVTMRVDDMVHIGETLWGKSVHFKDTNTGGSGVGSDIKHTFNNPVSSLVFEYYMRSHNKNYHGAFPVLTGDGGTDYTAAFAGAWNGKPGYIGVWGGKGGWIKPDLLEYKVDTWYRVRRTLDCATNTGTFEVEEVLGSDHGSWFVGSNYVNNYINELMIFSSNSQGADGYIDEVSVAEHPAPPQPGPPQLLFREKDTGIPGLDHVGLYPGGDQKVWESTTGYDSGAYWDPYTNGAVNITRENGVQQWHTFGSFWQNAKLGETSRTRWSESDSVPISVGLASDMARWIQTNAANGTYHDWWVEGVAAYLQKGYDAQGNDTHNYTCVGLIERAAEEVGHHGGEGFIPNGFFELLFTPSMQRYCATHPEVWENNYLTGRLDPVDFIVTDPLGRRLGFAGGQLYDEIPNAFYSGDGEEEMFIIPEKLAGEYTVQFFGVGEGYEATFVAADPVGADQQWVFLGFLGIGESSRSILNVVPEPSAAAMLAAGVFSLLAYACRRRRRR